MKTISLVQVGFQTGPEHLNAFYLPYSVGTIWTYASTSEYIRQNYKLNHVIWRRDDISQIAPTLAQDDIVLISCYVWNKNYNMTLAEQIKSINPNCTIIMGGPEPAIEDDNFFYDYPFIDILIKLEGELVVRKLLENWEDKRSVSGLLLNTYGQSVDTGPPIRVLDLSELPSPYLEGFFDDIIEQNPEVEWNGLLETTRGCPYQCTFCDWGSLTYTKIKQYKLERVFAEIEWLVKNAGFVVFCDANFGIFTERDDLIIDHLLAMQQKHNREIMWSVNWAKNMKPSVLNIVKKLMNTGEKTYGQWGLTLSVQSMNPEVLDIIKRKNMHAENIGEIFRICENLKIPSYTDFIIGLPGETLHSWKENYYTLYRSGIHTFIENQVSQLLPNAEMTLTQKEKYDLQASKIYDFIGGPYNNDQWPESTDLVCSTNTMNMEDMIEGLTFNWFIAFFHTNGFTNLVSRFLFKNLNVDYADFYDNLYEYIQQDSWMGKEYKRVKNAYRQWYEKGRLDLDVDGVKITGWNLAYMSNMTVHKDKKFKHVQQLVKKYISKYNIPADLESTLLELQNAYMTDFRNLDQYPLNKRFDYNIYDYIINDVELLNQPTAYRFEWNWDKNESWFQKYEKMFYQRRVPYTKTNVLPVHDK